MTGFARRAAAGLLAAVFGISMLAGCTPNNAAVGDTQSAGDAVAHSMKDRNSLDVAMIGSQDEQTDRLALDAMEAGAHPVPEPEELRSCCGGVNQSGADGSDRL